MCFVRGLWHVTCTLHEPDECHDGAEQIGVDEEMTARRLQWERQQATDRKRRADKWREARRRLNGYQEPVRGALLAYWQGCKWPADPSYFLSMLHMYDTGRLSLNIPKA